ncbi:MAG TPA: sigma 54-interacting transcriptional regulator [Pseudacidobacterium sp.]|jgi:formate hydrogenlyase transcriptional activator|nr:sigma 54-interacting transcriptional regulator [Pseudacidobacterium sp.]
MATSLHGRRHNAASTLISPAQQYEAVVKLSRAIGAHQDADAFFRAMAKELRSIISAHAIGIVHYRDFGETVHWCGIDIEDHPFPFLPTVPLECPACRWVYEYQQPLVIDLTRLNYPFATSVEFLLQFGVVSVCVLPLTTAHRRLGAILFASRHAEYYSDNVIALLSVMANQIALALDGAYNFAELQLARTRLENETTKLKLLLDLNNAIVSDLELTTLMQEISPRMRGLMQLDAVALILPDSSNGTLRLHALDFPDRKRPRTLTIQSVQNESIATKVFRSGQPWIGNLEHLDTSGVEDPATIAGLQTVCVLPLIRRNRVVGVLGLGRLQETAFAQSDIDFLLQVARQVAIAVDNALAYRQVTSFSDQLIREKLYLEDEIRNQMNFKEIVGTSTALRRVLQHVETVAPTETTVLICGETGTGKELIARAIHNISSHKKAAFVKVNCAALPAGLLESELFGHEKGAFTGAAAQRIGRFELANQGTIFLDEISELPLELQPKLLRVLQEREFERLGSSRTLRTNARLIAATNRDLKSMVAEQEFRADLFYRLNVFPLELPPLRERPEDIPSLVSHFVQHFSRSLNKQINSICSETMDSLIRYAWPGNIRELQNVIERAVLLADEPTLKIPQSELSHELPDHPVSNGNGNTLQAVERSHILSVLKETNWVFSGPNGAAARLGIKRSTLQFRMKKLGISRPA